MPYLGLIRDQVNLATPGNGFQRNSVDGRKSVLEALALIQIDRVGMHGGRG